MTYLQLVKVFLSKALILFNSNPKRREPGDGSDGYCDCIGFVIGSIRRMGLKWTGIHGSNWAARNEVVDLKPIKSQSELEKGDLVFKGKPYGKSGWDLPERYRKGKKYYNGDLTDYYHAGIVFKTNPLEIRHMSSRMTIDKKINIYTPWTHAGKSRQLIEAATDMPTPSSASIKPNTPATGKRAVVVAESGGTVNMRRDPSLKARLIVRVPLGRIVEIVSPGEEWAKVSWDHFTGYMMAKFLDVIGDGKGKY